MTQLYSNLVKYVNSTTYLCLVLAVLWSPVVVWVRLASLHTCCVGQACLTAHLTTSMDQSHCIISSHVQLSKCPLFIIMVENKGGPTHGFKNKESTLLNGS